MIARFKDLLMSKLSFSEIEDLAAENKPMPNNMLLEDQSTFLALRSLYSSWRGGHVGREQAQEERRRLKIAYEKRKELLSFYADSYKYNQDNIRRSEGIRTRLLSDMAAGKDVLSDALKCIGHMRNDVAFISAAEKYLCMESEKDARDKTDSKTG